MSPVQTSAATRLPRLCLAIALAAACGAALAAGDTANDAAKPKTAKELLEASSPSDWRTPDLHDVVYMQVPAGRVVIELAPRFAPEHVANIRTLAHEHYWDGLSIYRSQDNFVVQFGDPEEDEAKRKSIGNAKAHLPAEFTRAAAGLPFDTLPDADGWAPEAGFSEGFPAARDPAKGQAWMAHCYGTLGAGRDVAADSSNGTELYVVDGQSPRTLDRNITVVGRVLKGMELLSVIPRGPDPMGFYEDPGERTPILSIALASDVPESQRTPLQVLRTDTPLFARLVEMKRNRTDDWYKVPAGHIDLCNVNVPVRTPPAG
jgi:peptidylprolyl isomerase